MNRNERRRLSREQGASTWRPGPSPKVVGGFGGWLGEMDRAYTDGRYAVMVRTTQTSWGLIEHACIRNDNSTEIPWREKQRIKNELFGADRVAIEVFPAVEDLVDSAMMYHLWILPPGIRLPFGLTIQDGTGR